MGSITIDADLLDAADPEHEQVHVVDVDNGARFETYTIAGERGSGVVQLNGAAARLVHRGDTIIVISYGQYDEAELERYAARRPRRGAEQPHHHHRRAGGDPALLSGRQPAFREEPMSSHPKVHAPSDPGRLPMTLPLLMEKKRLGDPIVMVTAYDYPSARAAEAAGVDLVLVGDSAATTVLGYNATTPVVLEDMLVLARAVSRGLQTPLLIGDLPFGSYEVSDEQAITTVHADGQGGRLRRRQARGRRRGLGQAGARDRRRGHPRHGPRRPDPPDLDGARRLEGAGPHRRRGSPDRATRLWHCRTPGCFAIVFEAIPSAVTDELMPLLDIPVIGIGAGPATDGQVLVFHDLLGIRDGLGPRFVKRYANLQQEMNDGVIAYAEDVRSRRYPGPEHTYSIDPAELADLQAQLRG